MLDVLAEELTECLIPLADRINCKNRICPLYLRGVRDGFSHRPMPIESRTGKIIKTDWYLDLRREPPKQSIKNRVLSGDRVHSGVVTYDNVFSEEELRRFEHYTDHVQETLECENTAQRTQTKTECNRTKYFFGFRYLDGMTQRKWRDAELTGSDAKIAHGVRDDVDPIPKWCACPIQKLVDVGIINDPSWINQVSLNDYHTGRLGLGSHYDDKNRFARPIITLRLFSDSRLSFGLSHHNSGLGTMIIPLKRGRLCVMLDDSYAANDVKHTIRNQDLTHRSASLIFRHIHSEVAQKAREYCSKQNTGGILPVIDVKGENFH